MSIFVFLYGTSLKQKNGGWVGGGVVLAVEAWC